MDYQVIFYYKQKRKISSILLAEHSEIPGFLSNYICTTGNDITLSMLFFPTESPQVSWRGSCR